MIATALYLTTEYSAVITALLALALLAFARTHARPAMAVDALLLVIYASKPAPGTLTLFLALWLIRWMPSLASQAADLLGYPWHGLTAVAGALLLPAALPPWPPARRELPPVQVAIGKTTALVETHARPMSATEWMRACNDDATAPHLGVIGPTQLGKTTLALALAGRRPGEFVITTTKDDAWAGGAVTRPTIKLEANKGTLDWTPIMDAINSVHVEMLRRNLQHDKNGIPITLIVDEFSTTLGNVSKDTKKQMLEIWSMGASCGVRTIVIAQEVNATSWGLEGRRDILGNLLFARVTPGRLWSVGRLDPNGGLTDPRPLDTAGLVALAAESALSGRGWVGVPAGAAPSTAPNTHTQTQTNDTRIALYMRWRGAGMTRDIARALRQADGDGLDDAEWAEAGKRLANTQLTGN